MRARVDAVLVGSTTALADDPELTARRGGRVVHRPVRVLVDSRLRVDPGARIFAADGGRAIVLCAADAPRSRRRALEARGARVLVCAGRAGALDLRRALALLAREGLTEVLVEGGGRLAAALLRARLVDELHWFAAPRLVGADGAPALGPLGVASLARTPVLRDVSMHRRGDDLELRGRIA
jgi:diaminohydroxyphosphoribosylaminopyrimidine deaminase/5-amino-6-(5-phosphoribosylamino)uracil reductase